MKFSILLLFIALGIIAFVDGSLVDHYARRGDLRKRLAQADQESPRRGRTRNGATTSTEASVEAAAATPTNRRNGGQRNGRNGQSTSTSADAETTAADANPADGNAAASSTSVKAGRNGRKTQTTSTSASAAASNTATPAQNQGGGSNTCLAPDALQTGSQINGQEANSNPAQVESKTSDNNFINVCAGETLTNGKQIVTGSCNGIPLGFIPAKENMPSSLITFPEHNQDIAADTTFTISVKSSGIQLGSFTNAQLTYYSAPTFLNNRGQVIGHTHVTVQDLGGSFTPNTPLDPTRFAFFLGINTPADGNGQVFATVPNGLPAGFYRVCTLVANANHSPLQMPVAQRGAQDDCRYFSVGQGTKQSENQQGGNQQGGNQPPASSSSSSAAAAATTTRRGGRRGGRGKL